jgi:hypothetical protein
MHATFADAIKGGLHTMSLAGQDAVLAAPHRTGKIEPTALFKRFLQAASDLKPKMIGIASSANVYAGSEIDRAQVQQFLSLMTKLAIAANGAVVLVTHPSLTGINSDSGLSGSMAWHNSVRARAYMRSIEPEEGQQPDTDLREITFKKNNYGPVSANIVLRYQNGLFLPVPGMSSLDQAARDAKADDVFFKVLRHLSQQGQDLGPNRTASNYAPSVIAKHPDAKGCARMNSKPRNSACSTPTGSTSIMLAPIPNVANTSQSDRRPSKAEGSLEKVGTRHDNFSRQIAVLENGPRRPLPGCFQDPSDPLPRPICPTLPSSFQDPSNPLPRPVRSPPIPPPGPEPGWQAGNLKTLPRYRRIERTPAARARSPSRNLEKVRPLRRPARWRRSAS